MLLSPICRSNCYTSKKLLESHPLICQNSILPRKPASLPLGDPMRPFCSTSDTQGSMTMSGSAIISRPVVGFVRYRAQTSLAACAALFATSLAVWGQETPKDKETPEPISYYRQIRPIFQQHCQGCHQPAKDQGGFVMTDHASLLKSGNTNQPGIVPGQF